MTHSRDKPKERQKLVKKGLDVPERKKRKLRETFERKKLLKLAIFDKVRRGYNMNTLRRELRVYGFLSRLEGPPEGPWYLSFDVIDANWFDRVWGEEMGPAGMAQLVDEFLAGRSFAAAFAASGAPERRRRTTAYLWFVDRLVSGGDPPRQGTFECLLPRAFRHVTAPTLDSLSTWFELRLVNRPEVSSDDEVNGVYVEVQDHRPFELPYLKDLGLLRPLPEPLQGVLQALNYSHVEPGAPEPPPIPDPNGLDDDGDEPMGGGAASSSSGNDVEMGEAGSTLEDDTSGEMRATLERWLDRLAGAMRGGRAAYARVAARFHRILEELFRWPDPPFGAPALALPGGGALPLNFSDPGARGPDRGRHDAGTSSLYVGHNGLNPMTAAPAPPAPAPPAFVGVLDVGQGNMNMIVDSQWRVLAYYDMGCGKDADMASPVPTLCFCHQPTVILSHWDQDHYRAGHYNSECFAMQWIVPEQGAGNLGSTVRGNIRQAGGTVYNWPRNAVDSHIRMPWGYLERCNAGDANRNSSGIAAFICVHDDAAAPYVPPAAPPLPMPVLGPQAQPQRARRVVHEVANAINALGHAAQLAALRPLVEPVAAALGAIKLASNLESGVPNGALLMARAATEAVVAAQGAPPAAQAAVIAAISAANLPNVTAAQRQNLKSAIADAAIAVVALPPGATAQQRARVSADEFVAYWFVAQTVEDSYRASVVSVLRPAPAAPVLLPGPAPRDMGERFILLNGDANFQYVPSVAAVPPKIVGLTAMHHGSYLEDAELLAIHNIPWAPGSRAARAAHAAGALGPAAGLLAQINAAATAVAPAAIPWTPANTLRVSRAAAAAAAAVLASPPAVHVDMLQTNTIAVNIATAAAAAVIACSRSADGDVPGVAAVIAATIEVNAGAAPVRPILPVGEVVDHVDDLVHRRRAGPVTDAAIIGPGIIHKNNAQGIRDALPATPAVPPIAGHQADGAARYAATHLFNNAVAAQFQPIIGPLASNAVNGFLAGAGGDAATMVTLVAGGAGATAVDVQAVLDAPPQIDVPWTINDVAALAARLAAESMAGHEVGGLDPEVIAAAVIATTSGTAGAATAVHADPESRQIAYSYGVKIKAGVAVHTYRASTLGDLGHAHPLATAAYSSRGWSRRMNTSPRAAHGGPEGDPSPAGHAALCWDTRNDAAYPPGQINYNCPDCGNPLVFNNR